MIRHTRSLSETHFGVGLSDAKKRKQDKRTAILLIACAITLTGIAAAQTPTAPTQSNAKAAVPVTMTECEGTNNCATWTFLGGQGNGNWPSGEIANLSVEKSDDSSVVIRRADSTGASAGLTATYTGTRHGDQVGGEYTSSWPGHWDKKSGNWYATVSKADNPPVPSVMHFCAANCKTLVLENGHYKSPADPGVATWTVVRFSTDLVLIDRVDSNGYSAHYKGKIAPEGNRLINVVRDSRPFTPDWTPSQTTNYDAFTLVWGTALDTLPGSGPPPGQPQQVIVPLVRPAICVPWFFTIVCG